ncbi:MAG: type III pantothenate kinase [Turneriella sp.]|nr:type III pantothenate kinase [Turneriella sp.]
MISDATLAVDVGNSHSVFGLWRDGRLLSTLRAATDSRRTADEWYFLLKNWLGEHGVIQVHQAAFCSVVPAAEGPLRGALYSLGVAEPLSVGYGVKLNFGFRYPAPETVGADRIADLVAATFYFGPNCIVVDFGTAITFSVTCERHFIGGVIAPGITSSLEALFRTTARLPRTGIRRTTRAIGQSTAESLEIGAYAGWRGLVIGICQAIRSELPENGSRHVVIATGGISESLGFAAECFDVVDRYLTLKGIYLAASSAY